jgi:hypothetical protein
MKKGIDCARTISSDLKKDWLSYFEEINLYVTFEPIFYLGLSNEITNTLIAAIIYSYDNDSKWIDLRQESIAINSNILKGLHADMNDEMIQNFIHLKNDDINNSIGAYLDLLPDWRFITARKQMDYHAKYVRETETNVTSLDEDKKIKARENIGKLIKEAISQRKAADELLLLIEKDYVSTNHRVSQDFNSNFVQKSLSFSDDTPKDDGSWRFFIKHTKPLWEEKNKH